MATVAKPRDAATLILLRERDETVQVLMGVRGSKARFMPDRRVFPGGAVDAGDWRMPVERDLAKACMDRLGMECADPAIARPLALAAIRETFEETGLALGEPPMAAMPRAIPKGSWSVFSARGLVPSVHRLTFVFRAITPPTYPIRFDARFFLAHVGAVAGDPDDLSEQTGELLDLRWIGIEEVLAQDGLPFITRLVLREVRGGHHGGPVRFFSEGRETHTVRTL